jgi:RNA polymerase sigma factor (sigma-70 family)
MTPVYFEQMVVNRTPFLQQAALQLTRNSEEAKDLVQDTLLLALKNHAQFTEGSKLEAWLYTILRNSFINNYRKQQHRREVGRQLAKEGWAYDGPVLVATGANRIMLKAIEQKIEELPAIYRDVLKLRLAGYQYNEISEMIGEHLGTTKSRIHFAKQILKRNLSEVMD